MNGKKRRLTTSILLPGVLFAILSSCSSTGKSTDKADEIEASILETVEARVELIHIEGGTFRMGGLMHKDEKPIHTVTIDSFCLAKYPVTQKLWYEVMGTTIEKQRDLVNETWLILGKGDDYPMYYVNWYEAVDFCNRLSRLEGLTPVYSGSGDDITCNWEADGYRLPSEAEWEYAARGAGSISIEYDYSGSNDVDAVAWYSGNSAGETHPVGQKEPNILGLYDMSGNIWEWCWDWHESYYEGPTRINPKGALEGSYKVWRGGSWSSIIRDVRSSFRSYNIPIGRGNSVGFRVARTTI